MLYQMRYCSIIKIYASQKRTVSLTDVSLHFAIFYHVVKKYTYNKTKIVYSSRFGLIRDVALIQQDSFMYILGVYILFSLKAIHCDSWKLLLVIVFAILGQYFLGKKVAPILKDRFCILFFILGRVLGHLCNVLLQNNGNLKQNIAEMS